MTKASRSKVSREIRGYDEKDYVVTLTGAGIMVREKGKRTTYGPIPADTLLVVGAKLEAKLPPPAVAKVSRGGKVKRGILSAEK